MTVQKFMGHYTNLIRDLLWICSNNDFLQWVVRKYGQRSNHLSRSPALVFLLPFRCVITWNQKNLNNYLVQRTVTAPVLKTQTVLREMMLPFRSRGIILSTPSRPSKLSGDDHKDRSTNNYKQTGVLPATMTIGQAAVQRVSTMGFNWQERFDSHSGGFLLPLNQMSYLKSSPISSPKSKTISSEETQRAAWRSFEEPMMKVQSLPTTSHPSIDINRLTDQVYRALERKIHLEKQRKGYR
jgi:hypothetical protein